ncbi:hypothetical protein [Fictibacillus sp. NRS-1165]|uniref:hypothetical protein n=1 Tax=Fictibacillus sp. NRS-1165 TaxID=3144463 RepID=UPI003D1A1401
MTIEKMIKEMETTLKEIKKIGLELKHKNPDKKEILNRVLKHSDDWAFHLTQRVIGNYRKPQIEKWYKQSKVSLKHAKRVQGN